MTSFDVRVHWLGLRNGGGLSKLQHGFATTL
jgi:hypothetical protein